jgi:hypothetical protein
MLEWRRRGDSKRPEWWNREEPDTSIPDDPVTRAIRADKIRKQEEEEELRQREERLKQQLRNNDDRGDYEIPPDDPRYT